MQVVRVKRKATDEPSDICVVQARKRVRLAAGDGEATLSLPEPLAPLVMRLVATVGLKTNLGSRPVQEALLAKMTESTPTLAKHADKSKWGAAGEGRHEAGRAARRAAQRHASSAARFQVHHHLVEGDSGLLDCVDLLPPGAPAVSKYGALVCNDEPLLQAAMAGLASGNAANSESDDDGDDDGDDDDDDTADGPKSTATARPAVAHAHTRAHPRQDEYVYDIYFSADGPVDFADSCVMTMDDLAFGDDDDEEEERGLDDEDSNSEGHYANDYPDEPDSGDEEQTEDDDDDNDDDDDDDDDDDAEDDDEGDTMYGYGYSGDAGVGSDDDDGDDDDDDDLHARPGGFGGYGYDSYRRGAAAAADDDDDNGSFDDDDDDDDY